MQPITKEQIKRLQTLGSAVGLKDGKKPIDSYHALIIRLTDKTSTKNLTSDEFTTVERELLALMRLDNQKPPTKPTPQKKAQPRTDSPSGMISKAQIGKVWQLFYTLKSYDATPSKADDRSRMRGIINKFMHVDTTLSGDLFAWITSWQGHALIEFMKREVEKAEKKAGVFR